MRISDWSSDGCSSDLCLSGSVQVAAGPREHVEPGRLAPGNRELRQVQRRLVERQQRDVAAAPGDQHVVGLQLVVQQRVAVAVGLALEESVALRIEDPQLDAADRTAVAQRGRVHVQLVLVGARVQADVADGEERSEEHTSELQSLMRISYAVFCLK